MNFLDKIKSALNVPSRREDLDYTKPIPRQAKIAVFLLLYDLRGHSNVGQWIAEVANNYGYAHLDFIPFRSEVRLDIHAHPLDAFRKYLLRTSSKPADFLDFLEQLFRHDRAFRDNSFVQAINLVLQDNGCPYKLTEFAFRGPERHYATDAVTHYPQSYLAQDSILEKRAVIPALRLLSDPAFAVANTAFLRGLERHRKDDYAGCITACTTAVEGPIKVAAKRR